MLKVDTMRKIDFYLGVPLTWTATFFIKIIEFFNNSKIKHTRKILFIELSEMGSTIIADPAIRKAKKHFNAELFFLIFAKNKMSLEILNTIPKSNIFTLRDDNMWNFMIDIFRFIIWSQQQKIDTCFDLELFSRATALLSVLSGAKNRVGFDAFHNEGLSRGRLITHKVAYNNHIHMAKNFIAMVNALISNNQETPYSKNFISDDEINLTQVNVRPEQKQVIFEKIKFHFHDYESTNHMVVLINPNSSEMLPQRCWPQKHFKTLIEYILADYSNALILVTGSLAEKDRAQELCESVNDPRCINFAGEIKFLELIPLYHCATIMISNDSGPGHFSAVTPLKTIVLFGPETPTLYRSLGNSTALSSGLACSPCVSAANHRKTPCINNLCMQVLKPDIVMSQVKLYLNKE
jgi:ADP-heptose:LPS heptosyltransferase